MESGLRLLDELRNRTPSDLAGYAVTGVATRDGVKLLFEDESWILFRQSGTEPLLRVYCEATTVKKMTALMDAGEAMARQS